MVHPVTGAVALTAPLASISILRTLPNAFTAARPVMARAAIVPLASISTVTAMTSALIAARLVTVPAAAIARQGNTSIRAREKLT